MKSLKSLTFLTALCLGSAGIGQAQVISSTFINNTNAADVTAGSVDYAATINVGTTLYFAVPYTGGNLLAGGAIPLNIDISTFMYSESGSGSYSVNFYTGIPGALTAPTAVTGFTAGTGTVNADISGGVGPYLNGPTSYTVAHLAYSGGVADPFTTASGNGLLYIGFTNTGASTLDIFIGNPVGGTPEPVYTLASPLNTGATQFDTTSYDYTGNTQNQVNTGLFPYITAVAYNVPEASSSALAATAAGAFLLIRRRKA